MYCFRYQFTAVLLFQVLVMALGVGDGEEDCIGFAGQAPILCYECISVTDDHHCADPFNETHPRHELKRCKEYCVKWTRYTLSGKTLIQRTCSSKLEIKLRKNTVCIHESRPSEGVLCFCNEDYCNKATMVTGTNLPIVILAFITSFFITRWKWLVNLFILDLLKIHKSKYILTRRCTGVNEWCLFSIWSSISYQTELSKDNQQWWTGCLQKERFWEMSTNRTYNRMTSFQFG